MVDTVSAIQSVDTVPLGAEQFHAFLLILMVMVGVVLVLCAAADLVEAYRWRRRGSPRDDERAARSGAERRRM